MSLNPSPSLASQDAETDRRARLYITSLQPEAGIVLILSRSQIEQLSNNTANRLLCVLFPTLCIKAVRALDQNNFEACSFADVGTPPQVIDCNITVDGYCLTYSYQTQQLVFSFAYSNRHKIQPDPAQIPPGLKRALRAFAQRQQEALKDA